MTKPRQHEPVDAADQVTPTAAEATVQIRAGHRGDAERVKDSIERRREDPEEADQDTAPSP